MTKPVQIRRAMDIGLIAIGLAVTACGRSEHPGAAAAPDVAAMTVRLVGNPPLDSVLSRSCGDCHTNSMAAGWYTRTPPFSAAMSRGAREGRKAVNFAQWASYSPEQQRAFLVASCADARAGKMPVALYVRVRPDAALSPRDVETICAAPTTLSATATTSH